MGSSFKSFRNIFIIGTLLFGFNAHASLDDCSLKAFVTDSNNQPITSTLAYQIDFYSTATSTSTLTTAENGLTSPTAEGMVDVSYSCPSFLGQRTVFLELTINGVVQSPRIEVTSVPSAIIAQSALSLDSSFTIDTNQISDAAIGTNQIASGAVTASRLAATGVTAATYGSSSTVPQIAVNAQGQITSASSVAISVAPSGSAGGSLTGTYPNPTLTTDSVGTTNISDSAVTTAKINNDAVTTAKISDGTIAAADIADGVVSSAKITDGTIATADLADSSVTSAKIVDKSIVSGDVSDDALDFGQLSDNMTLDATTIINSDSNNLFVDLTAGLGSFAVRTQPGDSYIMNVNTSGFTVNTDTQVLLSASNVAFGINLTNLQSSQRLCHDGADAGTGFVNIGDCDGAQADLAEYYGSYGDLEEGDVVTFEGEGLQYFIQGKGHLSKAYLAQTTQAYDPKAMGVISTNPFGEVLGEGIFNEDENPVPLALVGRVPVKATTMNGDIQVGDFLTSSNIPGYAMKATESGSVLGVALEKLEHGNGRILMFLKPMWHEVPKKNICESRSGHLILKKGEKEASVTWSISERSVPMIQITPQANPEGSYWIQRKDGSGFTLEVENKSSSERAFDWATSCEKS